MVNTPLHLTAAALRVNPAKYHLPRTLLIGRADVTIMPLAQHCPS